MELEDLKNDTDAAEDRAAEWIGLHPKWALAIIVGLLVLLTMGAILGAP